MGRELPSLRDWQAWRDRLVPAPRGVSCTGTDYDRRTVWIILKMIQGHRCGICLGGNAGEMDYNRATGRIRGLLCESCRATANEGTRHPVLDAYRACPPTDGQMWLYGSGGGTEPDVASMTDADLRFAVDMGRLIEAGYFALDSAEQLLCRLVEAGDVALDSAETMYRQVLKHGCDTGLLAVFGTRIG